MERRRAVVDALMTVTLLPWDSTQWSRTFHPEVRIDHILFRPGQPAQRVVVNSALLAGANDDPFYPSDHRAVPCDLSWNVPS